MSRQEIVLHLCSLLNRTKLQSTSVIMFLSLIKLINLIAFLTHHKKNTWFKLQKRKINRNYPGLSFQCSNSCYLLSGQIIFLIHHSRCYFFNIGDDRPYAHSSPAASS